VVAETLTSRLIDARARIGLYAAFLAVLAAGTALRAWQIGYSFDADEVFSVELASRPFGAMLEGALLDTPHPPLHIVLLHFWSSWFGTSEIAARSLSVVTSVGFLCVSWRLLRRFLGHWFAVGGLAILAVSPLFVLYGQQARPYALIALLAALNLLAFLRFLDAEDRRAAGLAWAASCAALLYAQYMGILAVAVQLMYGLLVRPARGRQIVGYAALGCLSIVPWALLAMGKTIASFEDPLPQVDWMTPPASTDFVWFYVSVFGESRLLRIRWLLLVAGLVAAFVVRRALRRQVAREYTLLVALAVLPPLLVYLLSVMGGKPLFASRQLLGAALAFVLVTGLCAAALPRAWGLASLCALVLWAATSVHDAFPAQVKPPWREIGAFVDSGHPASQVVVDDWWIEVPLRHYARRARVVTFAGSVRTSPTLYMCRAARCASTLERLELAARARHVRRWTVDAAGAIDLFELPDGVALPRPQ
jgi:4-amino-4-deoxy-L-arabinose transferase-like glycosyltransferase